MDDQPQATVPEGGSASPHDDTDLAQRNELRRLREELGESAVVEQARGILMERYGYDADQAGRALSRLARQHGVARRAYADSLVATAPDPRTLRPAASPGADALDGPIDGS